MEVDPIRIGLEKAKQALWGGVDIPGALVAVNEALRHLDQVDAVLEAFNPGSTEEPADFLEIEKYLEDL